MSFKLFLYFFLLSTHCALSQNEEAKIELPVNWANDFSFISNHSGYACLFLDQKDKYCILLLDSSYREVAEFKDSYYTATTPDFVGSISDATGFELFFKRIEDNVLLVLKIDIKTKKINRIKDFKITGNTSEKILYTGSNLGGNKMLTISYDKSNLIFKKHLFGLKTENTEIPISAEDYKRLKDNGYSYLQAFDDTLIMISRSQAVTDKNPVYTAYYFDLRNKTYRHFDFGCGQEKTQPYLYADFFRNTFMLENCNNQLQLFDGNSGEMIKVISIDYDSVFQSSNTKLFRYCYLVSLGSGIHKNYTYVDKSEYKKKPKGILSRNGNHDCAYDFIEDSTNVYLKLKFKGWLLNGNQEIAYYTTVYLPFDWKTKEIIRYASPEFQMQNDSLIIHELDVRESMNTKTTGYFIGFDGNMKFGYIGKKTHAFTVESVSD